MLKIAITYECQTPADAIEFLARLDGPGWVKLNPEFGAKGKTIDVEPTRDPNPPVAPAQPPAAEAPRKRERKTKAPEVTKPAVPETPVVIDVMPTPQPAAAKQPNAPVQAVAMKPEEATAKARALLLPIFNTKGAAAATAIMKEFGVTRLDEFKADQLPALEKACKL